MVAPVRWPYNSAMPPEVPNDPAEWERAPQFRLRTLFFVTAFFAVLFAVMGAVGPVWSVALLLLMTLLGLHVAGNALGTTLRDRASDRLAERGQTGRNEFHSAGQIRWPMRSARLCEHTPVGWTNRIIGITGALCGAILGGLTYGQLTNSPSELAVGATSFAVLGAFLGFLLGSFVAILLRAWNQAAGEMAKAEAPTVVFQPLSLPELRTDVPLALVADIDAG